MEAATVVFFATVQVAWGQINLGSFNLGKTSDGLLGLGFNQGGSLFGFGADRGLGLRLGEGVFDFKSDQGATIAGQRLGLNSGLGIDPNTGLSLGSALNSGNSPVGGDPLQSFLSGIASFFQKMAPPTSPPSFLSSSLSPISFVSGVPDNAGPTLPASVGRITDPNSKWEENEKREGSRDGDTADGRLGVEQLEAEDPDEGLLPMKKRQTADPYTSSMKPETTSHSVSDISTKTSTSPSSERSSRIMS